MVTARTQRGEAGVDWNDKFSEYLRWRRVRLLTLAMAEGNDNKGVPKLVNIIVGPDCSPLDFLQAVMRCNEVPLFIRQDAAKAAAQYIHPRLLAVSTAETGSLVVKVEGGLPPLPGTNTIMPGEDINRGKTIEGEIVGRTKVVRVKPGVRRDGSNTPMTSAKPVSEKLKAHLAKLNEGRKAAREARKKPAPSEAG
jgi:hypothetical protein